MSTATRERGTFDRTLQQRLDALQTATAIRSRRASLKERIKQMPAVRSRQEVARLLEDPPEHLGTMKTWDLVISIPTWGRVKVNKTFSRLQISPSKTIDGLSTRQRRALADRLRDGTPA